MSTLEFNVYMVVALVTRIDISYRYSKPVANVVIYRGGRGLVFLQVEVEGR